MSAIPPKSPMPTPAPTTSPAGASQGPAAPKSNSSNPTTQPGHDQFDPAQTGTQYQASINQEILPHNGGEQPGANRGKSAGAKKTGEAPDLNDPTVSKK